MMLSSILVLLITNPGAVLTEMVSASTSALSLCIELCAVYAVWLGIMELVDASVENPETQKLIALNVSANMLGLGNAATPMGIKSMQALDDGSGKANFAMIMLIVINATSIQLLPTTIIGLRTSAGSTSPADIILPTLIVTFCTTILGITLVYLIDKVIRKIKKAKKTSLKA